MLTLPCRHSRTYRLSKFTRELDRWYLYRHMAIHRHNLPIGLLEFDNAVDQETLDKMRLILPPFRSPMALIFKHKPLKTREWQPVKLDDWLPLVTYINFICIPRAKCEACFTPGKFYVGHDYHKQMNNRTQVRLTALITRLAKLTLPDRSQYYR